MQVKGVSIKSARFQVSGLFALVFFIVTAVQAEDFSYTVALDQRSSGTTYVTATIGQALTLPFLVDTGSSLVVVNKKAFEYLKAHHEITKSHQVAARMANGRLQRTTIYRVSNFSIGEGCHVGEVEVAVIPKGNNIMGMNVLSRAAPFAMQMSPPALILSDCTTGITQQELASLKR